MRIVTASRRTDVPAFFSGWLLARVREGYCHVRNPVGGQIYRVSLAAEDVAALGLYTRDPRPLLRRLPELRGHGLVCFAHVTVNGYGPPLETRAPRLPVALAAVRSLAEELGPGAVVWRYDPVLLVPGHGPERHRERFAAIASVLHGSVSECYVSFVDPYRKTRGILAALGLVPDAGKPSVQKALAGEFEEIAGEHGIAVRACSEPALATAGIRRGSCADPELVAALRPDLNLHLRQMPGRPGCGCCESTDIGAYDTCGFGCAYCYATSSPAAGRAAIAAHDPADTILARPASLIGVDLSAIEKPLASPDIARREPPATLF